MTRQTASGGYLQPVPLGLPYNSTGDDLLLAFNAERHLGYLVSDRYAPHGMVTIYRFVYNDGEVTEVPSNDPTFLRQYAMLRPYRITQRADVDYTALLSQQTTAQPAISSTSQGAVVSRGRVLVTPCVLREFDARAVESSRSGRHRYRYAGDRLCGGEPVSAPAQ